MNNNEDRQRMIDLINFVRVHNKMGKSAEDLLQQFQTLHRDTLSPQSHE